MKNKLLYIIVMTVGLSSCSQNFLNLIPQTSVSSASFYQNETEFNQALVGAYTNLRGIALMGFVMDEMRSDNTFFTYYAADRGTETSCEAMAEFLDNSTSSQEPNNIGDRWGNDYSGIAKVNTILTRIKNNVGMTQGSIDSISGEALFLRAFYYFDLVQHYGAVPLQLVEVTSTDGAFLSQSPVADVYKQIITDLTNAMPNLSIPTTFPQSGRATQGAAKMLLAYAYMSEPTKDYTDAETALLDITKMHYSLMANYADVFDPTEKNNKESIFEVQYQSGTTGQQSDWIWRFIPKTTNTEAILGLHGTNLRGGITSGGWNVPTQELVDSYEPGDLRLPASIAVAEGTQDAAGDFTTDAVKSIVNYTPTSGKVYYYFANKYLHPPYSVEWNTDDNWPVYRYAGALLLLSECLVDENKNSEALPYINQVRERAGLPDLTQVTKEDVTNEMRHELAFENHRWTDLIREEGDAGAVATMNAKGVRMKALYGWLLPTSFTVTTDRLLYAIPDYEMQMNSNLVQNPGY
jgi:hypothetical protein